MTVTIFRQIYEGREVSSKAHFDYLRRRLAEAIARGWIEQIPVMKPNRFSPNQEWYRDKETGEIYYLDPPGERGGWWDRVDPEDLVGPNDKVQ